MADYNIYIHSINGNSTSKTKPRDFMNKNTKPTDDDDESSSIGFFSLAKKGIQTLANPKSALMGAVKGVAPLVAMGVALKITDRVITTVEPFISQASGDYRFSTAYNNTKAAINYLINPIGSVLNVLRAEQSYHIANLRNEQERLLLGDSIINQMGGNVYD